MEPTERQDQRTPEGHPEEYDRQEEQEVPRISVMPPLKRHGHAVDSDHVLVALWSFLLEPLGYHSIESW